MAQRVLSLRVQRQPGPLQGCRVFAIASRPISFFCLGVCLLSPRSLFREYYTFSIVCSRPRARARSRHARGSTRTCELATVASRAAGPGGPGPGRGPPVSCAPTAGDGGERKHSYSRWPCSGEWGVAIEISSGRSRRARASAEKLQSAPRRTLVHGAGLPGGVN